MVPLAATDNSIGRQQLYLALRKRIEEGQYLHGAWLPAERGNIRWRRVKAVSDSTNSVNAGLPVSLAIKTWKSWVLP